MMGYLSINTNEKSWILHVSSENEEQELLTSGEAQIKMGNWKKGIQIVCHPPHDDEDQDRILTKVLVRPRPDGMEIGPFIGILTTAKNGLIQGKKSNFKDIIEEGKRSGAFVYVIPVDGIDFETQTVLGYCYNREKKKWYQDTFPLPHVIYNRIPNRRAENHPKVQKIIKKLTQMPTITFYNPQFFNKSHLYQILQQKEQVSHLIPETVPFTIEHLQTMLQKYPVLYVKAAAGRAGKGIFVLRQHEGNYRLQYQEGTKIKTKSYKSIQELYKFVANCKFSSYVIQQGLPLETYHNRKFDFRVLVQKDGRNHWRITGIGVRVAREGGITTHVPRGGMIETPEVVLDKVFPKRPVQEIVDLLKMQVMKIAQALEETWPTLAEASMDIGIDKEGKLWFIEANSKPEKFDEPAIRQLSLKRLIEYAQFKSHFSGGEGNSDS